MKLVSWNVNGLRACLNKGFMEHFDALDADVFCIQESKMQREQQEIITPGYHQYWNSADKKGYSGTVIFTKKEPLSVIYGIHGLYSDEGRLITLEYDSFYIVTSYSPNAQPKLARLEYRMKFEDDLREYITELSRSKSVILCGDLNVAHREIDLKNPKTNRGNPGFSDEEREKFTELLSAGFTDTFRYFYPDKEDAYTWWSYFSNSRAKNIGWRIDYFVVSKDLDNKIQDSIIYPEIMGSDHCPVCLEIDIDF